MANSTKLTNNTLEFNEFTLEENGTASLLVKKGGATKATFDTNGILFNPTGTELSSNNVQAAIPETIGLSRASVQCSDHEMATATYGFATATGDALMSSGLIRLNNTTPTSATEIYFHNNEAIGGANVRALFGQADDQCSVYLQSASEPEKYMLFTSTSGVDTSESGYMKILNLTLDSSQNFGSALAQGTALKVHVKLERIPATTVSQNTNPGTAVTINSRSGVITTRAFTTIFNNVTSFTVNNNKVTTASNIQVTVNDYAGTLITAGVPYLVVTDVTNGSFVINVVAISIGTLNGVLKIGFLVM